jgi:hypothetical protein
MDILSTSDSPDVNYMAQIVRLDNLQKHPNAGKLQIAFVCGSEVVTGLQAKLGDLYCYFPIECQIEAKYLAWSNSYSDAERNHDVKVKGFFPSNSRVKMVKLRGTYSNGYIVPVSDLENYIKEFHGQNFKITADWVDFSFDTICGDRFVRKYERPVPQINVPRQKTKGALKKYETKLVEGQFAFHQDTLNFRKDLAKIAPDDVIVIENKIHGASFIVAKVLIKRLLKLRDKVAKTLLRANIQNIEYGNLYASRTVVKNKNITDKNSVGFYDTDIWKIVSDRIYDLLDAGVTVYGEVFGFTPKGGAIQPKYDYGCPPNQLDYIVYKGTLTLPDGKVYVMSQHQLESYCAEKGFKMAEKFYHGPARDLFPELDIHNHWHENFLKKLEQKFLEKKCWICKNDVWAEGVVIKREIPFGWDCLKLKSINFLGYETQALDSQELSAEEADLAITN